MEYELVEHPQHTSPDIGDVVDHQSQEHRRAICIPEEERTSQQE